MVGYTEVNAKVWQRGVNFLRCQSVETNMNLFGVCEIEQKGSVEKMVLSAKLLNLFRYACDGAHCKSLNNIRVCR